MILNYNSWKMAGGLAQRVASYDNIDIVVVVDNLSTDGSYGYLKKIDHRKIHIIQSGKNGGYSYGNNYGAKVCGRWGMDIVFFANPDISIGASHIQKILEQFARTDYSVLSGIEYGADGESVQPLLWRRRGYWEDIRDCFLLGRRYGRKEKFGLGLDKGADVQCVEMVKGSFFGVRLEDFNEAGGFDEGIFLYCEERILSKKMEGLGKKIGIVPSAGYTHTHSASIQQEYRSVASRMEILYKSRLYYHKKYNGIGWVRRFLLSGAMKISLLEFKIREKMER